MDLLQQKLLKNSRDRIAAETGYQHIEVRLTNAAVISVRIDGQVVTMHALDRYFVRVQRK